jgi:hypothetical protein
MTKEDWAEVDKRLPCAGYQVQLDCDGYRLSIQRARLTKMRDCLVIYVNGVFKGKWMTEDCEERRRFLCPRKTFFYKPKARAKQREMLKKWSKREIREFEKEYFSLDPDKKITWYSQVWPSLKPLKAHLTKNNKEISIIREHETAGQD